MRNKDIEKNIKTTISSSKERVWDRIEKEIFQQETTTSLETATINGNGSITLGKNKPLVYTLCAILIALAVAIGVCIPKFFKNSLDYSGSFFIDINPSVQIMVDKDGLVTEVLPLNQDALVLLQGLLEYKGKSSEEVAVDVWELAYKTGYISPTKKDNAVLVTGSLANENLNEKFGLKIKEQLTAKIKEKGVYCAVLTDTLNVDVKQKAEEIGISASKYQLIKSAINVGVKIDEDEYKKISVTEINERIKEFGKKLNDYGGTFYEDALKDIQNNVEEQIELIASILGECINNVREIVCSVGENQGKHPHKNQIERDLNILGEVFREIENYAEKGINNKVLFDKLDASIKSISEKDELIALQFQVLKPMVEAVIGQYDKAAEQITAAKSEIKEKHDKVVAEAEQTINEHVKQEDFEEDYERWLEEVCQDYRENWDKNKSNWQNSRK